MKRLYDLLYPKPKTDVEYVIEKINKKGATNALDTDLANDHSFTVGKFVLQFGTNGTSCQFKLPNDIVPMFIFEGKSVETIRQAVIASSVKSH